MSDRIIAQAMRVRAQLPRGIAALIGVSGCQGSGKTYNSQEAVAQLRDEGISAVAISLDDYYLDHKSQLELRSRGNPLLARRGLPGTHSLSALISTLENLRSGKATQVLQYDKSQFSGEGDQAAPILVEPVEVVVLEGWMLGFEMLGRGLGEKIAKSPHALRYEYSQIEEIDTNLGQYAAVWRLLDALVLIKASSLENIYTWRLEQEHAMIARSGSGMTDAQVKEFVDGYMPAYELYLDTFEPTESILLNLNRDRIGSHGA